VRLASSAASWRRRRDNAGQPDPQDTDRNAYRNPEIGLSVIAKAALEKPEPSGAIGGEVLESAAVQFITWRWIGRWEDRRFSVHL
jgi:hypothetical protein